MPSVSHPCLGRSGSTCREGCLPALRIEPGEWGPPRSAGQRIESEWPDSRSGHSGAGTDPWLGLSSSEMKAQGDGGLHTVDRSANNATRLWMMGTPSGGENLPKASVSDSVNVNSPVEANRWRMQGPTDKESEDVGNSQADAKRTRHRDPPWHVRCLGRR